MSYRNHGGTSNVAPAIPKQPKSNATEPPEEAFQRWCKEQDVKQPILKRDHWVRTNAPGKTHTNKALAVIDSGHCIVAQDHITKELYVFAGVFDRKQNRCDRAALERDRLRKNERRKQAEHRALKAVQHCWSTSEHCISTTYTKSKGVGTHGCRWDSKEKCLLVPMRDIEGRLKSLQRIFNNKTKGKRYFKGVPVRGLFFTIGCIEDAVLICEGFATGATLHQETGKPVVCAMDAGNLLTVAMLIRDRYSSIEITICGDDDRQTRGNPGRTKATAAADAVNGKLAMPNLCGGCSCTDFNDQANCNARGAGVA